MRPYRYRYISSKAKQSIQRGVPTDDYDPDTNIVIHRRSTSTHYRALFVLIALIPIFCVISIMSDVNTTQWVQQIVFRNMGKSPKSTREHIDFVFHPDTAHVYNFSLRGIVDKDFSENENDGHDHDTGGFISFQDDTKKKDISVGEDSRNTTTTTTPPNLMPVIEKSTVDTPGKGIKMKGMNTTSASLRYQHQSKRKGDVEGTSIQKNEQASDSTEQDTKLKGKSKQSVDVTTSKVKLSKGNIIRSNSTDSSSVIKRNDVERGRALIEDPDA